MDSHKQTVIQAGYPRGYDYTHAKDAADDLDYSPDQYEDFELLEPEDFLKP